MPRAPYYAGEITALLQNPGNYSLFLRQILQRPHPVFAPERRLAVIDVRKASEEEIENSIMAEIEIPSSEEAMKEVEVLGLSQTKEEENAEKAAMKIAMKHAVKAFKQIAIAAARAAEAEDIEAAKTAAKEVAKEIAKQEAIEGGEKALKEHTEKAISEAADQETAQAINVGSVVIKALRRLAGETFG